MKSAKGKVNVLEWKTEEYELYYETEKLQGYVFVVDGKPLEYEEYVPLSGGDVKAADYLSETPPAEELPYAEVPCLASCNCGFTGCDAVHAIVRFENNKVFWSVFKHNCYGGAKPEIEEVYCFDKKQYSEAIRSLLKHIDSVSDDER